MTPGIPGMQLPPPNNQKTPPPPVQSIPPKSDVQIRFGGVVLNVPAMVLTAIITMILSRSTPTSVIPSATDDKLLDTIAKIDRRLSDLEAAATKHSTQCNDTLNKEMNFSRTSIRTIVSVLKRPPVNAKIRMADGSDEDVEYHEPPLNPLNPAPQVQPKIVIPASPQPI